jgi:hypothetical protein
MSFHKTMCSLAMFGLIGFSSTFAQEPAYFVVTDPAVNGNRTFTPTYDPSRDDRAAIQATVDAAKSATWGGIVYFPKGFYFVKSAVNIGNPSGTNCWQAGENISLKGEGRYVTHIYGLVNSDVFVFQGGQNGINADAPGLMSSHNSVSDLSILKNSETGCQTGGTALDLRGTNGAILENVEIRTDGAVQFSYGIRLLQDETRIHNIYVGDCNCGIALEGHCNSTSITESQIWRCLNGIYVIGGACVRIQNNTFGMNTQAGIRAATNVGTNAIWALVITGNEMEGNGISADKKTFYHNNIWIQNTLHTPVNRYCDYVRGVTISDNYFNLQECKKNGVFLTSPYDISNTEQQKEITFNRNVYQVNSTASPSVLTEGLTVGKLPVGQ